LSIRLSDRLERNRRPERQDQSDTGNGRDGDPAQVSAHVVEIVHGGGGAGTAIASFNRSDGAVSRTSRCSPGTRSQSSRLLDVAADRRAGRGVCGAGLGGRQLVVSTALAAPALRAGRSLSPVRAASSSS